MEMRRWWLAALAFAGVVVTHALSYRLAISDHALRAEVLHDTGHGLWPPLIGAAAVASLVAALAGFLTRPAAQQSASLRATAVRLAALQAVAWLAVEAVERAATGHHDLTKHTVVPVLVGLAVQVVVAGAAAVVLALAAVTAAALGRRLRPLPERRRTADWRPVPLAVPRLAVAAAAWSPRGPPLR